MSNMSKKYHNPKTPNGTPINTLCREIMYSYIQNYYGMQKMKKIFANAKKLEIVKTPNDFRKWVVNECIQFINTVDDWLQKKTPPDNQ